MQHDKNTANPWLRRTGLVSLCAGLAAFTLMAGKPASAYFATEPEEELGGDFDEPMKERAQGRVSGSFSWSSTTVDDDGTWTIANKNGALSVEHDGKKLADNRFRERRGQIEVLDENGKVIKRLATPRTAVGGQGLSRMWLTPPAPAVAPAPNAPAAPRAPRGFSRVTVSDEPKVMLGVTMSDADGDLLDQLGLDNGVLVVSVRKGLPADKAGLQAKDVIFSADGENDIDEQDLRDLLRKKNPGEELKLKVKRRGEDQELTVTLEKYDRAVLSPQFTITQGDDLNFDAEQLKTMLAEVEEQVRTQALALREKMDATDWNKVRDQVSIELDKAMQQMAEAREKAAAAGQMWWQNFSRPDPNSPDVLRLRELSTPRPSFGGNQATDSKLDKLAEQLEKLNSRLDEMEKKIDKK